jgi:hypothetical protein
MRVDANLPILIVPSSFSYILAKLLLQPLNLIATSEILNDEIVEITSSATLELLIEY